jgi:predicted phage terminase large subunit-like protein
MYTGKELTYIKEGRHRARTDLLWLGRHIVNASYPLDKVVPHVHGPLAGALQQFYD